MENTVESLNRRYSTMQIVGDHLAELIPQGGTILTQCFGETIIGTVIRAARRQNKDFKGVLRRDPALSAGGAAHLRLLRPDGL